MWNHFQRLSTFENKKNVKLTLMEDFFVISHDCLDREMEVEVYLEWLEDQVGDEDMKAVYFEMKLLVLIWFT